MTELETEIREVLSRNHVSFAELSAIEGFKGDLQLTLAEKNLVLWCGVSQEACDILNRLQAEGEFDYFHGGQSTFLAYVFDGITLQMPIAKGDRHYKKAHWLPVTLKIKRGKEPNPHTMKGKTNDPNP
jgi:hypothetical protein